MKRHTPLALVLLLLNAVAWGAGSAEAKESYLRKAEKELKEWNAKVDALQKRSAKAGARTRVEFDRDVLVVQEKLGEVRKSLTQLQGSGESGWKGFSREIDEGLRDVKRAYRKAASFFSGDDHPKKDR